MYVATVQVTHKFNMRHIEHMCSTGAASLWHAYQMTTKCNAMHGHTIHLCMI